MIRQEKEKAKQGWFIKDWNNRHCRHEDGIEGRPIALLVQRQASNASKVHIQVDNKKINAKSALWEWWVSWLSGRWWSDSCGRLSMKEKAAEGIQDFWKKTKIDDVAGLCVGTAPSKNRKTGESNMKKMLFIQLECGTGVLKPKLSDALDIL